MTYQRAPLIRGVPNPVLLGPCQELIRYGTGVGQIQGWPAANRAIYLPFSLPIDAPVASIGFYCSAASGNYDIGVLAGDGTTLVASKGTTALVATSINTWTPTGLTLMAGLRYYAGLVVSTGGATFLEFGHAVNTLRATGCAQEALSSTALVATATPAQITSNYFPAIVLTIAGMPT